MHGNRKFVLGLVYMLGSFAVAFAAVLSGVTGWDALGVSSLIVGVATGLGTIVWGNAQEHRAKAIAGNGGGGS